MVVIRQLWFCGAGGQDGSSQALMVITGQLRTIDNFFSLNVPE
jgi:hypothetical protein